LFRSLFEGTIATSDKTYLSKQYLLVKMEVVAKLAEMFLDQRF